MADGYIETIENVQNFLNNMRVVLCSEDFDLDNDMDLLLSTALDSTGLKNAITLDSLGFDKSDVRNTLLSLTIGDYSETLPDKNDKTLPPLYMFGKIIYTKEVYIKVKIRDRNRRQVFCWSFHYAQFPITKPYMK